MRIDTLPDGFRLPEYDSIEPTIMQRFRRPTRSVLTRRPLSQEAQDDVDMLIAERSRLRDPELREIIRMLDLDAFQAGDFMFWFAARQAKKDKCTLREAAAALLGSYGDFCESCGGIVEGFMVNGEIWREAADDSHLLCMTCVERRLGRSLSYRDFRRRASTPLNAPWLEPASPLRLFDVDPEQLDRDEEFCELDESGDGQVSALEAMAAIERRLRLRRIRPLQEYAYRDLGVSWTLDTVTLVRVPEPTPVERRRGHKGHREVFAAPTGEALLRAIDKAAPRPPARTRFELPLLRRRGSRLEYVLLDSHTETVIAP